jgi:hypothetical protein
MTASTRSSQHIPGQIRSDISASASDAGSEVSEDELAQPTKMPPKAAPPARESTVDSTTSTNIGTDSSIKLGKPPKFTGGADSLADLLFHCEMKFAVQPTTFSTERVKVFYLVSHLTGSSYTWARTLHAEKSVLYNKYDDFVSELQGIHGKSTEYTSVEAENKLEKLKQTKSCSEYAALFDQYTAILKFNDGAKLSLFKRGLKQSLRSSLASLNETFDEYHELRDAAIRIDQQQFQLRSDHAPSSSHANNNSNGSKSSSKKKRGRPSAQSSSSSSNNTRRGPLTKEEREHRKKNNLCMYCGKSGHAVATCPESKTKSSVNATLPANVLPSVAIIGPSVATSSSFQVSKN